MNFVIRDDFFPWKPAAWLRVTGEDAGTFLQGQFTNDLRNILTDGRSAVYGLWLNQKGRVLADSFILRTADAWWVGSYGSAAGVLRERLEAFVIADDVMIEDVTDAWRGAAVFGEIPGEIKEGFVFKGRRGGAAHFEWVFPREIESAVRESLAGQPLSSAEMEQRRIAAGVPWVPVDLGPGDLPNEGGLETQAISYTKGCYLGQEVMARLKSMGQVRRHLVRVSGVGEVMPLSPLFQDGKKIGELRSLGVRPGGFAGLAMLTLMHWQREVPLHVGSEGGVALKAEIL